MSEEIKNKLATVQVLQEKLIVATKTAQDQINFQAKLIDDLKSRIRQADNVVRFYASKSSYYKDDGQVYFVGEPSPGKKATDYLEKFSLNTKPKK